MTSQSPSTPPAPPGDGGQTAAGPAGAAAAGAPSGHGPKTSGLAIASLVVGLLGFCVPIVGGAVGLVLGIVALRRIGRSGGTVGGKGLAIGGVVASSVSLFFGLVVAVVFGVAVFLAGTRAAHMQEHARLHKTRVQIDITSNALEVYCLNLGRYPTEADGGLEALWRKPPGAGDRWAGPYLKQVPLDPWDRPLRYEPPDPDRGRTYRVWSLGPDGIDGTADDVER